MAPVDHEQRRDAAADGRACAARSVFGDWSAVGSAVGRHVDSSRARSHSHRAIAKAVYQQLPQFRHQVARPAGVSFPGDVAVCFEWRYYRANDAVNVLVGHEAV